MGLPGHQTRGPFPGIESQATQHRSARLEPNTARRSLRVGLQTASRSPSRHMSYDSSLVVTLEFTLLGRSLGLAILEVKWYFVTSFTPLATSMVI